MSTPSTPRPSGRCPILLTSLLIDALIDELGELVALPAQPQRPVLGVHELDRGMDDRVQCRVEFESRRHHQHGIDQTVEPVPAFDDLFDPDLHLGQQLA